MNQFIEFLQQYAPLFGVLAAIATVLGLAFAIYKATHDRQMAALLGKIGMVRKQGGESDTWGKSCVCRQRNAIH